ncbi:MAG: hypothetical protein QXI20_07295 [Candidatus Jordarchaeales archaeon]
MGFSASRNPSSSLILDEKVDAVGLIGFVAQANIPIVENDARVFGWKCPKLLKPGSAGDPPSLPRH